MSKITEILNRKMMKELTAEEFFRNKIKELEPNKEVTMSHTMITAEQGLRWAHEFKELHLQSKGKTKEEILKHPKYDLSRDDFPSYTHEQMLQAMEEYAQSHANKDGWVRVRAEFLFELASKQEWVNRVPRILPDKIRAGETWAWVDKNGHVFECGADFMDAEKHDTYPCKVYRLVNVSGWAKTITP